MMSQGVDRRVISPVSLRGRLGEAEIVVVDVRWMLDDQGAGRAAYERAHIPGAAYLHLLGDLSDARAAVPGKMRQPRELADLLEGLGVGDETLVVAYDNDVIYTAARLVWMLAVLGHDRAALLDGGWPGWVCSGGPVTTASPQPRSRGRITTAVRRWLCCERSEVIRALDEGVMLLDCRMDATWAASGQHIPGARRLPAPTLTDPETGGLEDPQRTCARVQALGLEPGAGVILYCGGAVSAARVWVALVGAGLGRPVVYDGSWGEWSADPALPRAAH